MKIGLKIFNAIWYLPLHFLVRHRISSNFDGSSEVKVQLVDRSLGICVLYLTKYVEIYFIRRRKIEMQRKRKKKPEPVVENPGLISNTHIYLHTIYPFKV